MSLAASLLAISAWLACPSPAAAQSALGGIVKDANGRVVVGARVTVRSDATGREWRTASSSIGSYEIAPLPPGSYTVRVESAFYDTFLEKVELKRHLLARLDVALVVRITEELTVHAPPAPPEPIAMRDLSIGTTFTREALDSLPLTNGRTVQSMLLLVPGIVFTDSVGTLAQFTAAGQRRFANRMTIDGVSADLAVDMTGTGIGHGSAGNLPAFATTGGTQTLVPLAAIDEIAVRTTGASPEYTTAPGAITSIVTRSGGNRVSGSAFSDLRPNQLAAKDWLSNAGRVPQREVTFWNAGASSGGPLLPNRLFYFSTFERQSLDRPITTTIQVPSRALRNRADVNARRLLEAFPLPNVEEEAEDFGTYAGSVPASSRLWTLSNRFDAALTANDRLFVRMNTGRSSGDRLWRLGQMPALTSTQEEDVRIDTATVGFDSTRLSAAHSLRVNLSGNRASASARPATIGSAQPLPSDLLIPGVDPRNAVVTVLLYPGDSGVVVAGDQGVNSQRQLQLVDTWSWNRRSHEWKLGVDYRELLSTAEATPERYHVRFDDISDLLGGTIPGVTLQEAHSTKVRLRSFSLFAQDTYRPSSRWTFNYGVRYRVQPAPKSLTALRPILMRYEALPKPEEFTTDSLWPTTWKDASFRISSAYQLDARENRETIVRIGWGLALDEAARPGAGAFGRGRPYIVTYPSHAVEFPVPEGALSLNAARQLSPGTGEYYSFPQDLRSPRIYQWQLDVDRALGPHQRLSLAYVGTAGRDLFYWHSYLVPPRNQRVHAFSNDAKSDYHALLAEFTRRLSAGFRARVSYSWSRATDTDSGEPETPNPPPSILSPEENRGSADFDRRHVLQAVTSFRLSFPSRGRAIRALFDGLEFDVVGSVRSGGPFNIWTTRAMPYGFYNLRPDVVPGVSPWLDDASAPTGRRLNPAAFVVPKEQRQGTLRRNALRSSPLRQVDLSITRPLRIGARGRAQIRLEAFNVFNVPAFGPPYGLLPNEQFGQPRQSYAEALGTGSLISGGLAPIQQVGGARSIQIGLKVAF